MGKFWSIVFGATMAACFGLYAVSAVASSLGWWLPEGVSTHAGDIDFLFYVILYITGFFFALTEAILVIFMFNYAGQPGPKAPARPASRFFGKMLYPMTNVLNAPHKVELAWTIVPAAILLWIAFAQISTWADVKYKARMPEFDKAPLQVEVSARQFEWRLRYASYRRNAEWAAKTEKSKADYETFRKTPQSDDVRDVVNELHVWNQRPVVVWLSTRDVIHSFNLPHMRVKQDALPGKTLPVWFTPIKYNTRLDLKRVEAAAISSLGTLPENVQVHVQAALAKPVSERNAADRNAIFDAFLKSGPNDSPWKDGYNPKTAAFDAQHVWDLACAELCGWGHWRMVGRLYVHEDDVDFLHWLKFREHQFERTK